MEINKISNESTKEIVGIIIDDRLLEIKRLIDEEVIGDGDEFILTDIFNEEEWKGIHDYPGNWTLGRAFKSRLDKSDLPVYRHPNGKKRDQAAVYIVNKKI